MRLSDEVYRQARMLIANRLGLDFPENRRADLERGLARLLRTSSVLAPEAYLARLASLPDESPEWGQLAGHLTVGETYFFRDRTAFEALAQQVLPSLIATRRAEGILRLRLWSAGCATGEEPYSLAMLLDRLLPDRPDWALTILATDVSPQALEVARRGLYREWSFRQTPRWVRDRYFHRRGEYTFELDPSLRQIVTFAPLNIAAAGYPSVVTNTSAMDLILCRNVLMYFTPEARQATVIRLQRALVSGGWLVVSAAETAAELFHPLASVSFSGAIFSWKEPAGSWGPEIREPGMVVPAEGPGSGSWEQGKAAALRPSTSATQPLPPVLQPLLERARTLADQGNLDAAHYLCEAVLARHRLNPEAYVLLAAICQERGEIPAALEALRRAIYLAPDSVLAHFLLGGLLLRQGQRQQGQRAMETVVHLLCSVPRDEVVAGSEGLTAGRLLETARAYLESQG